MRTGSTSELVSVILIFIKSHASIFICQTSVILAIIGYSVIYQVSFLAIDKWLVCMCCHYHESLMFVYHFNVI